MKIRSITLFADVSPEIDAAQLARLGAFARQIRQACQNGGFGVQTIRLAMDLFPALAESRWAAAPAGFCADLERACEAEGFHYLALGPAGRTMLPLLPEILAATRFTFATAHIVDPETGAIDGETIRAAARIIRQVSHLENGFGNLRFAALANVPPGTPFFPAAYHDGGAPALALATQAADLAVTACQAAIDAAEARRQLTAAIEAGAARLVEAVEPLARSSGVRFRGIDFSLAPFPAPEVSIGAALELLSGGPAGDVGTLAAAAALTEAIDRARFPRAGFCGLMLPVLEDGVLARRAAEGRLRVGELLQWSAVCGTGLDTVPLPGDASEGALAGLLFDVAALSARLNKPLTARLMPLPGKVAGEAVHFDFDYFADGGVLPLDGDGPRGLLRDTRSLALRSRRSSDGKK